LAESQDEHAPVTHTTLGADEFPFTIQLHAEDNGELLWETVVTGAGALKIPGFHPRKVSTTIIDKDGRWSVMTSAGGQFVDQPDIEGAALIACRPYDPSEYSPERYQLWCRTVEDMRRQGSPMPEPAAGSIDGHCFECRISVAVGPGQQEKMHELADQGRAMLIVCLMCASLALADVDPDTEENP
jgi:hypothetical protein